MQKIYIDVPYSQKDDARLLGARWDAAVRAWYFTDQQDSLLFSKWFKVKEKPLPVGDRTTLKEFLSSNYSSAISLTFRSAKAFGIPYPLEAGWAKKYADRTALTSSLTTGKKATHKKSKKQKVNAKNPGSFVPLCNCNVAAWEDCEHTEALAHKAMRDMLA